MSSVLQEWVVRLKSEKSPGFAVTAQRLSEVTDDDSAVARVADVLHSDAAITVSVWQALQKLGETMTTLNNKYNDRY